MASDQVASYFLDIYCPSQIAISQGPSSSDTSLEEIHAWAATAKSATEKAQSLMADPGAKWPSDVADDVQTLSDVYYPPTIDYFGAILQEKTVTGAWNVPRPTYDEGGVSAQSNLSQKLGVDIGSSTSCEGR